jgi:hypothetical protein
LNPGRSKIFSPTTKRSIPALWPTYPPIQSVPVFFTSVKRPESDVNDIYLGLMSRMSGTYTYTPYVLHGVDKKRFETYPNISENSGIN